MQRTNESTKKIFVLAGMILAAMVAQALTYYIPSQANADTNAKTAQIQIVGTHAPQFAPTKARINVGDEVKFINLDRQNGGVIHRVLSIDSANGVPNGVFDSRLMKVGDTYTVKFSKHGLYEFIDGIYPAMHGYIVVD